MMDDVDRPLRAGRLSRRGILAAGAAFAAAALLPARTTSVDRCRAGGTPAAPEGRVAFVAQSGPSERPIRRVAVIDEPAANVRYLTPGEDAVFTPRFSPTGRQIVYASLSLGRDGARVRSRIQLVDSVTGERENVGEFSGMIYSPRFAPDDRTLVVSVARDDRGANLFAIDLAAKTVTRLTDGDAVDTAACYSPDGRQICFASDRDGRPQIYLMDAAGGPARRISPPAAAHMAPAWSARGDMIAFTTRDGTDARLGIMRPDGSRYVTLALGSPDSTSVIAPSGQALMFSRTAAGSIGSSLFTVGLDGCGETRVATPGFAFDPDWSAPPA
jgi:TolB protein